jgi:AraC-like DNA-binding protein
METEVNAFLYGMIAVQGLALSIFGWTLFRKHPLQIVLLVLGFSFLGFSLSPIAAKFGLLRLLQVSMILESLIPITFWFSAEAVFEDDFTWEPIHLLGCVALIVSFFNVYALSIENNEVLGRSINLMESLKVIHITAIIFGIRSAYKGWKHELIPIRSKLRIIALFAAGVILLIMIFKDYYLIEERSLANPLPLLISPIVVIILLGANYFLVKNYRWINSKNLVDKSLTPAKDHESLQQEKPELETSDLELKINELMIKQMIYKDDSLTITSLASKLKTPEYRLRAYIHSTLGYKNFNQYLAKYRIDLAKAMLTNPSYQDEKILSIAFEVGFASLAPFNKSFKLLTGLTPTEYREQSKDQLAPLKE